MKTKMNLKRMFPIAVMGILVLCSFVLWENSNREEASANIAIAAVDAEGVKDSHIQWLTLEEAYNRSQEKPRKTFIDVYTDWCGWCKRMDATTFSNVDVAKYANENFYAVKLDAESETRHVLGKDTLTERMVAASMGVRSFPTIVFLEPDFRTISPMPGYRTAEQFLDILKKVNESTGEKK